jgi:hypothetical protein
MPLKPGYRPELDQSPELDARRITYYQGLIGVLCWMCELEQIDVLVHVAMQIDCCRGCWTMVNKLIQYSPDIVLIRNVHTRGYQITGALSPKDVV